MVEALGVWVPRWLATSRCPNLTHLTSTSQHCHKVSQLLYPEWDLKKPWWNLWWVLFMIIWRVINELGSIELPYGAVTIRDTRLGNRSCDRSGDFSPTFSMFVYVCWCLFTYVWSLDLFGKLYIVLMLRELTSLSFNIDFNTPILSLSVWGRPGDWGASLYAEPKSATWGFIWTMGELIVTGAKYM